MKTSHRFVLSDSRTMREVPSGTIDLVVTSPPYPMIEMWDDLFSGLNPEIRRALREGHADRAYSLMHEELDRTWKEVYRVLRPGAFACINIGDATRKLGRDFQLFPNHARVIQSLRGLGMVSLPHILWRKTTNKPNKYMGSGMLPAGAYVTLEHEYVLVMRKGGLRATSRDDMGRRRESAYFWEERNEWFSDVWMSLNGVSQRASRGSARERSGAFPFELAYRLINMYSLVGDTVLDPFLGTGTTMMAAMAACRNSLGYELGEEFGNVISRRFSGGIGYFRDIVEERIEDHKKFVESESARGREFKHRSRIYGFPVMTSQEQAICLYQPTEVLETGENAFEVHYAKPHVSGRL
jgi:DNA modification methylase